MAGPCGSTCPVDGGFYTYDPSLGGNGVLLAVFALLVPVVLYMGYRFRTPLFSATLTTGILFEVLGFIGRVLQHGSLDNEAYFFLSLLGTVLGPTFIATAVFLILPHVLSIYGVRYSPVPPLAAGLVLYSVLAAALILELVGVIFAAYAFSGRNTGAKIAAGGLGVQVAAILAFSGLHLRFTLGMVLRERQDLDARHSRTYSSPQFKKLLIAIEAAAAILFVHSVYRLIELAGGVSGELFQTEAAFMVVVGAFPLVVCILVTILHPGEALGVAWAQTSPRGIKRRSPPCPIGPPGHAIHHRYDPEIRKQPSPTSQRLLRHSVGPPEVPTGSPGLPANPKPVPKASSPHSPLSPSESVKAQGHKINSRVERQSQAQKNLVDSEELW
ncbi:hypothetical protein G7046_g9571 [Stylonectria norvegica]|nr:hypothetical protein G7046_g9571 [Stylonectria norvegica]